MSRTNWQLKIGHKGYDNETVWFTPSFFLPLSVFPIVCAWLIVFRVFCITVSIKRPKFAIYICAHIYGHMPALVCRLTFAENNDFITYNLVNGSFEVPDNFPIWPRGAQRAFIIFQRVVCSLFLQSSGWHLAVDSISGNPMRNFIADILVPPILNAD